MQKEGKLFQNYQVLHLNKFYIVHVGLTVFELTKKRPEDKRKRHLNDDPGNIEGFIGPWGKFVDEKTVMKPDEVWNICI